MLLWKNIKDFDDYWINIYGEVESLKHGRRKPIKQWIGTNKYMNVTFSMNGVRKNRTVHSLVAEVFLGHSPDRNKVVDHIDQDKTNNRLDNLRIISHRENLSRGKRGNSKYTGIHFCETHKLWKARIQVNKKRVYLGGFKTEKEAHHAYESKLKTLSYE